MYLLRTSGRRGLNENHPGAPLTQVDSTEHRLFESFNVNLEEVDVATPEAVLVEHRVEAPHRDSFVHDAEISSCCISRSANQS